MDMNKTSNGNNPSFHLVKRICILDSMMTLPVGESISMEVRDFAPYQTIASHVYRMNNKARQAGKPDVFRLEGSNNYTHFTLERLS